MKKIFFLLLTFAAIYSMDQNKAKNRKGRRKKRQSITIKVPDIVHADEEPSLTQRDRTISMMLSGDDSEVDKVKQMMMENRENEESGKKAVFPFSDEVTFSSKIIALKFTGQTVDAKGENIFHWLVKNKSLGLLQFACNWPQITGDDNQKNGAINQKNRNKQTPLHLACSLQSGDEVSVNQKIEIISLLYKKGAIYETTDKDGKKPLDYLTEPEIEKLRDSAFTFESSDNEASVAQKIELINYLYENGYLSQNGANWKTANSESKIAKKTRIKRKRKTQKKVK